MTLEVQALAGFELTEHEAAVDHGQPVQAFAQERDLDERAHGGIV